MTAIKPIGPVKPRKPRKPPSAATLAKRAAKKAARAEARANKAQAVASKRAAESQALTDVKDAEKSKGLSRKSGAARRRRARAKKAASGVAKGPPPAPPKQKKPRLTKSGARRGRPPGARNKLSSKLRRRPLTLLQQVLKEARPLVKKQAKKNSPVDTGNIRKSISVRVRKGGLLLKAVPKTGRRYGHFIPVLVGDYTAQIKAALDVVAAKGAPS